jgi:hypothetical protein
VITRTLSRRLERLEERMIPIGEATIIHIVPISPDGTQASVGFSIEVPCYGSAQDRRLGPLRGKSSFR